MLEGYYMNALTQELVELLTLEKLKNIFSEATAAIWLGNEYSVGKFLDKH
jgi:hypothetical protein